MSTPSVSLGSRSAVLLVALVLAVVVAIVAAVAARERSARKRLESELNQFAHHDRLTGLPNRSVLETWVADCLTSSRRHSARAATMLIDLDRFKRVNDTYGPNVGDELMKAIAARLRTVLRPQDKLIRSGGTQFAMLCPEIPDSTAAEQLARRVLGAIQTPFQVEQDLISTDACVGLTVTDERLSDVTSVLLDAEVALYKAKDDGPGTIAMYEQSMHARLTPANANKRLTEALARGEFQLLYLPIISLENDRMTGVEALIRWMDPERGLISPGEFLPAMEETGLIVPVGEWVLQEACRQIVEWEWAYPDLGPLDMTVNVSARQVAQSDFLDVLREAVKVPPGTRPPQLCLEVSEAALRDDLDTAWTMLRQAKELGISLALDDFGTGSSSIQSVRTFRSDVMKIDQQFVQGLGMAREDTAIVELMIALANELGMVTIAEGVETPQQLETLRKLKCHRAQGYLFGHPVSAQVIEDMLYDISLTRTHAGPAHDASLPQRGSATPAEVLLPVDHAAPSPAVGGGPASPQIPAQSPAAWPGSETEVAAAAAKAGRAALAARVAQAVEAERRDSAASSASASTSGAASSADGTPIQRDAPRPHDPQPLMAPRRHGPATPAGTVVPPVSRVPRRRSELAG